MLFNNIIKKILIVICSMLFLAACAKKDEMKIDFRGPTSGPDPAKMQPAYGPND